MSADAPAAPFSLAVATLPLELSSEYSGGQVEGSPTFGRQDLWRSPDGGTTVGVWEMSPGAVTAVVADEAFTVLFGRATITAPGRADLHMQAGDVVVLRGGEEVRFEVHETLRKVFCTSH